MKTKQTMFVQEFSTPCGKLLLGADAVHLCLCYWVDSPHFQQVIKRIRKGWNAENSIVGSPVFEKTKDQLNKYFSGDLRIFDLPLTFCGTPFQQQVWNELLSIPYGECWTYKDLALSVGNPNAVRAVASAVGVNPFQIIVPCHRVLGGNGKIGNYAGGKFAKEYLLESELSYKKGWIISDRVHL